MEEGWKRKMLVLFVKLISSPDQFFSLGSGLIRAQDIYGSLIMQAFPRNFTPIVRNFRGANIKYLVIFNTLWD